MKKKLIHVFRRNPMTQKILLTMRLTLFLMILSVFSAFSSSYAQKTKLSLNAKNVQVKEVLNQIENQSEFFFMFDNKQVDVERKVSLEASSVNIDQVLQKLFEGTGVNYRIVNRQILLFTENAVSSIMQQKSVSGKLTDSSGSPLPGVTVVIKGTTNGTITDGNGNYSISNIPENAKLKFSFVGMKTQEIEVGSQTSINITMVDEAIGLDEVVAVGYGVSKKRDLTGSIASVQAKDLIKIPVSNVAEAITGKLAGVQITTTEGDPGAEIKVRVRGGGSITQDNSPLYIIDGFPSDIGLSGIDPNDVQSIDVLKDASSTSIYGARGANGVIIITTKMGLEGKFNVTYNGYSGFRTLAKKLPVLNSYDYVYSQWERQNRISASDDYSVIIGLYGPWDQLETLYRDKPSIDWQEEIFGRNAITQSHNFSINGGTKLSKYNVSYTRNNEDGIMLNSSNKKDFIKFSLNQKVNERISFVSNVSYLEQEVKGAGTSEADGTYSALINILQYRPTSGISESNNDLINSSIDAVSDDAYSINPRVLVESTEKLRLQNNLLINTSVDVNIFKGLTFKLSGGLNTDYRSDNTFWDERSRQAKTRYGGPSGRIDERQNRKWNISNVFNYVGSIEKHNLNVMLGQEANRLYSLSKTLTALKFPNSDIGLANMGQAEQQTVGTYEYEEALNSFFGRVNYSYDSRYLFSASLRQDGSSKFDKKNRFGYFPAASVAWRISDEPFFKPLSKYTDNLKLRYSYGSSGNNRIANYLYSTNFSSVYYGLGKTSSMGVVPNSLANPDLKWETTNTSNLGLDAGFFKNRLTLSAEFYLNKTKDLLLNADIPSTSGYDKQILNIGSTENKGMELVLDGVILNKKNFSWTANFNISFNKNIVTGLNKIGDVSQDFFITSSGWGYLNSDYLVQVGKPIGLMYGYVADGMYTADDFVDASFLNGGNFIPANLKPDVPYALSQGKERNLLGQVKVKRFGNEVDAKGHIVATTNDLRVLGDANPKHFGGFNTSFASKGFDLSVFLNWVYGNSIYNATKLRASTQQYSNQNLLDVGGVRYTMVDPLTGTRVLDKARLNEINTGATMLALSEKAETLTSWTIEDGSFLRINNITLGYSLPNKIVKSIHLEKLRIYGTAYNVYTFTNYTGYDPEVDTRRNSPVTPGVDYAAYPRSRQFIMGVNVIF